LGKAACHTGEAAFPCFSIATYLKRGEFMAQTIVQMEGISKYFAGIKALDGVQIDLKRGEVHALMGENGAGKSTLMKIMTGVYIRDEGIMRILNDVSGQLEEIEVKTPLKGQRLGLSMVFQELNLLENMSVAENIFLGREPVKPDYRLDRKRLREMAARELEKVKLDIDPDTPISELSTGQKQCVEIAKALSFEARVVVFDEPTASLSERESQTLFELVRELKSRGICIVYISHRMEEVFELADRITVFRNGQYIGTIPNENITEQSLIKMMIGRELSRNFHSAAPVDRGERVLSVRNVKVFPKSAPVSFDLHKGEILGFFGLVGAGRTELTRILFGIDPIGEGTLTIHGQRRTIKSPRDAINSGIGLVPEDRKGLGLILGMSIKDNMLISKLGQLKSAILNTSELQDITSGYKKGLGIVMRDEGQPVKDLSGGNQQKVVIAKWLAMTPDILIMDEPTRGIDVGSKREIYNLIRRLADEGKSIIMISSEVTEIIQISDRIIVMHEGEISAELDMEQATKNNIVQAAFGGTKE